MTEKYSNVYYFPRLNTDYCYAYVFIYKLYGAALLDPSIVKELFKPHYLYGTTSFISYCRRFLHFGQYDMKVNSPGRPTEI